jgi:hypothetical protein
MDSLVLGDVLIRPITRRLMPGPICSHWRSTRRVEGRKNEKRERESQRILLSFLRKDLRVLRVEGQYWGDQKYVEDMAFPTLRFPSDHGSLQQSLCQRRRHLLGDKYNVPNPLNRSVIPFDYLS